MRAAKLRREMLKRADVVRENEECVVEFIALMLAVEASAGAERGDDFETRQRAFFDLLGTLAGSMVGGLPEWRQIANIEAAAKLVVRAAGDDASFFATEEGTPDTELRAAIVRELGGPDRAAKG